EGNAWQYSWYVPQDVAGFAQAYGGADRLLARLDEVFDARIDPKVFAHMEDITGLIGWYAHGNEPSHHIAYLYAAAGQPWRTQARLQKIMDTQYAPRADGLAGNDDLGQMSAWYLFTALGFYPLAPASNEYIIGRPFLKRAVLHLPNGRTFTVRAPAVDDAHPYVAALTLNGRPLRRVFLRHEEIMAGGELLGARQSGVPMLRFADLERDLELLEAARAAAERMLREFPERAEVHLARWLGGRQDYLRV
ncbi:MAG TPA: glycoside hydrolase domain-containing protein, partial [Burkholderiales bacterium]|nr:glycoside hydrolase domain-containing protein [Burkholderiales bacterium]